MQNCQIKGKPNSLHELRPRSLRKLLCIRKGVFDWGNAVGSKCTNGWYYLDCNASISRSDCPRPLYTPRVVIHLFRMRRKKETEIRKLELYFE